MNMPLVLLNRRRRGGAAAFTPAGLFALAEPGVWYDPSDLTTLFQDTAGTTPVTTPGQTVALALDKSKGLVLGSELVTNGDFSSSAGWIVASGVTISGGLASFAAVTSSSALYRSASVEVGKWYEFTIVVSSRTSGGIQPRLFGGATQAEITAPGTYRYKDQVTSANFNIGCVANAFTGSIDNISVKELPGFHATQATLASRPTYGIVPLGGRRNLLTRTEEFNDAAWLKLASGTGVAPSVTANAGLAPNDTATADRIVFNRGAGTTISDISRIFQDVADPATGFGTTSFYIKSFDGVSSYSMRMWGGGNEVNITVTGTWQRFEVASTSTSFNCQLGLVGSQNQQNADVLVWGAQGEYGSSATAYQRVGSAFDVTEAGVASLSYLSFDGVDDFLVTPTITPGIDKAQVFAGVRKLQQAAVGIIAELSTDVGANNGTFTLNDRNSATYAGQSKGTISSGNVSPTGTYTAPVTSTLTLLGDISADTVTMRANGGNANTLTADQGTGNFLAYPIYIGRRGGTTLPFNGQLYSLLVRFGTNLDAGTITSTETWVNGKTGAYA